MKAEGSDFFLFPTSFELPYPFTNHRTIKVKEQSWYLHSQHFKEQYMLSIASAHNTQQQTQITLLANTTLLT